MYNQPINQQGANPGYNQPFNQQGPNNGAPNAPYNFPSVSPEMLSFGINQGRNIIDNNAGKWTAKASGYWTKLKFYFSVDNAYVLKKLTTLAYPVANTTWNRKSGDEFERDGEPDQYSRKWAIPRHDPNSPDLYIPLMSFITYVLLYGLRQGIVLGSKAFSPDLIIQAIWRCLILQLIESGLMKFAISLCSINLPFTDFFAYSGYKYVGLCVNTLSRSLGGTVNFLVSLYTAGMLAFFILKTMAAVVPTTVQSVPPRHLILLAIAAVQFLVMLVLSWM